MTLKKYIQDGRHFEVQFLRSFANIQKKFHFFTDNTIYSYMFELFLIFGDIFTTSIDLVL